MSPASLQHARPEIVDVERFAALIPHSHAALVLLRFECDNHTGSACKDNEKCHVILF